jgi:DNA mismatch endonuclease (patch repair protein)
MGDIFSRKKRSEIMSRIRKTNTKPELSVRQFLFSQGLRYRLYNKSLPGNPDIVLTKFKTLIFVNGCFWHAHKNCKYNKLPKSNTSYWTPKILGNVERDVRNKKELKRLGWKVLTVWECELEKTKVKRTLEKLYQSLILLKQ